MSGSAADKARKCFALARSTTHAGERDAAVNRGLAILERAGLDPDAFDIPGRERKRWKPGDGAWDGKGPSPWRYDMETTPGVDHPPPSGSVRMDPEQLRRVTEAMQRFNAQLQALDLDAMVQQAIREAFTRRHGRKP